MTSGLTGINSIFQTPSYSSGSGITSGSTTLLHGGISANSLYSSEYLNKRDEYEQARNGYQTASVARDSAIDCKIKNIVSHIENNRADKAMQSYHELLDEMSKQQRFAHLKTEDDDTQLRATARDIIEGRTNMDLEELIKTNTSGAFVSGLSFDSDSGRYSQEHLLKEMCDLDETTVLTSIKNIAGRGCKLGICAGLAVGAVKALPFVLPAVGKVLAPVLATTGPIALGVVAAGLGAGLVIEAIRAWS